MTIPPANGPHRAALPRTMHPARRVLRTAPVLSTLLLGACTTVQITAGDGTTTIERQFGFATITVAPGSTPVVAGMSSLGYSSSPAGVSLGWSGVQFVALPDGCRVVLWVQRPEDLAAYRRLTSAAPDVCAMHLTPQEIPK